MNIDMLFPENGGPPALSLQLGGFPLADILAQMAETIRHQQRELDALRRDAEERMQRSESHLRDHDSALRRIRDDLRLDARPLHCSGQSPAAGTAEALALVATRLTRVERSARESAVRALCASAQHRTRAVYFTHWAQHHQRCAIAQRLYATARTHILVRYMRQWQRFVPLRTRQTAQRRRVQFLRAGSDRRTVREFYRRWLAMAARRRDSNAMARRLSQRFIAARGFSQWRRRICGKSVAHDRMESARALAQRSARELVRRFLRRWANYCATRHRRHDVLGLLQSRVSRGTARHCLTVWLRFAQERSERRRVRARVPHMHHASVALLARRYFGLLRDFCRMRREERSRQAVDQRLGAVHQRTDVLQRQLDVGLQTLAHTNSVLARVVDNVMVADEPATRNVITQSAAQGESVQSPGEVQSIAAHRFASSPAADREGMRASELLRNLRSRLDKTYRPITSASRDRV